MWILDEPTIYENFGAGKLQDLCRKYRGQHIHLAKYPELEDELRSWLSSQQKREVKEKIYRFAPCLGDHQATFGRVAISQAVH
jgi:hypothetical protein